MEKIGNKTVEPHNRGMFVHRIFQLMQGFPLLRASNLLQFFLYVKLGG